MANESSFLESDSFLDLPPLRALDKSIVFQELGTMFLFDMQGNEMRNLEFGNSIIYITEKQSFHFVEFLSRKKLLVLDRRYHQVSVILITEKAPFISL